MKMTYLHFMYGMFAFLTILSIVLNVIALVNNEPGDTISGIVRTISIALPGIAFYFMVFAGHAFLANDPAQPIVLWTLVPIGIAILLCLPKIWFKELPVWYYYVICQAGFHYGWQLWGFRFASQV